MEKTQPITATGAEASSEGLTLILPDRQVFVPWSRCSPLLANASEAERMRFELSPGGYGIHWPLIDEDLSVGGLLRAAGR